MNSFLYLSLLIAGAHCFYIENGTSKKDKILGGDYVDINTVPYQIQIIKYGAQVCGGSIISEYWILTAAHCVQNSEKNSLSVITGSSYRGSGGQKHDVEKFISHDSYSGSPKYYNDIALIKVTKPIEFNEKQSPIKIATPVPKIGDKLLISGYGREGKYLSPSLKSAIVPVIDHDKCYTSYIGRYDVTNNVFCAGVGGTDTCIGDSGGPAAVNGKLAGITSYGMECGSYEFPGVYTLVPNYRKWISNHTELEL